MSAVEINSEIKPLCVHCGSAMVPVVVRGYLPGQRFSSITAFGCEEPACGCLYNIIHGYFEITDGRISPFLGGANMRCPVDESTMRLAEILGALRIYKCCQRGCDAAVTLSSLPASQLS